ncbi:hypothetical protein HELRODRAFT_181296 [Helobdella robusta]|uniref:Uncharacterized protein n=1 Tax=Helobdella robusta TaxID=6412 RepID=T1FGV3_HELRO|nr:hypothetical protein HELRODRAFT_181296 [Helobdella robusta]ESN93183.1 hypothetical protein HELRODRAFT_181296 [Helobdella robusta]
MNLCDCGMFVIEYAKANLREDANVDCNDTRKWNERQLCNGIEPIRPSTWQNNIAYVCRTAFLTPTEFRRLRQQNRGLLISQYVHINNSKSTPSLITTGVPQGSTLYFGCKLGDQDKNWAPHVRCARCASSLSSWANRTGGGPAFGVPMVWREPQNHCTDCYFCSVSISGRNSKGPNLPLAIRPDPHLTELPVPEPPSEIPNTDSSDLDEDTDDESNELSEDANREPHFITGSDQDLVRDLYLTKQQSEVLASRHQQWHLLASDLESRHLERDAENCSNNLSMDEDLCFCNDISRLFVDLGIQYNSFQ